MKVGKCFEPLLVVLATVCILGSLALSATPQIPLRSHQEWIEHELDLEHYAQLKAEQEAERAGGK